MLLNVRWFSAPVGVGGGPGLWYQELSAWPVRAAGLVPKDTREAARLAGARLPTHTSALLLVPDLLGTLGPTGDTRAWKAAPIWAQRGLCGLWLSTENGLQAGLLWAHCQRPHLSVGPTCP